MKNILITGATDGLGRAVAIALAGQGHRLLIHGRNKERGAALVKELLQYTSADKVRYYNADFLHLSQIKALAEELKQNESGLDVLINNAGLGIEAKRRESADGNEALWQVNYLATYMLTRMLKPLLAKSTPARVVNIASAGQSSIRFDDVNQVHNWSGYQAYCQSKLAQIMLGIELSEEYRAEGITVNSLHPASMMPTKIVQIQIDTLDEGVRSVVRLAVDQKLNGISGRYFFKTEEQKAHAQAYDKGTRAELIKLSQTMTGI